jgi:hypothetical protein
MRRDSRKTLGRVAGVAIALTIVLLIAGCSSMGSAITSAFAKQAEPAPQEPAAQAPAPAPAQQPAAGPAIAYQYQFNAFYSGMWNMGWFGYGDANYKVGQGTVWTFTGTDGKGNAKDKDSFTLERALLKINADKSQWWRFKMDTGKDAILYEFLVGADTVVQKVRYQDPEGNIGEFTPGQGQQQPTQTADMPRSRADMAKYLVDKQRVTVKGGTFNTDHYLYTDAKGRGTAESWVSEKVPGYMVKSIYTAKKDNKTSKGELIQIESGVTTALSSF